MSATKPPLSTPEAFLLGGIAACGAVTVSNPAEVAKTRLQLQGELAKDGGTRVYRNTFDVLAKTARNEGIGGIQRGLAPADLQILVNGARLGLVHLFYIRVS
ncbi:Mitochondrial oxaloacetate carrier protein [Paramarasmius palmivorus]|uniref:Mitochondrial oxaloacetate carrier protein n=1 Tax=Paramarasmius palmivorus TaxID=297713 RepID=A0AAW0DY09_9AGAR